MTKIHVPAVTKSPEKPLPLDDSAGTVVNVNVQNLELHPARVHTRGSHGNCLSWCAFVLLLLVVMAGMATVVGLLFWYYTSPADCNKPNATMLDIPPQTTFSFDDIWDVTYRPRGFSGFWAQESDVPGKDVLIYRGNDGNVYKDDGINEEEKQLVLNNTILESYHSSTYYLSPDLQYALIAYDIHQVWRHSFTGKYVIIQLNNEQEILFPNKDELMGEALQFVQWAPDQNALSFVYKNNLYYQSSPEGNVTQITNDGETHTIFNGIPDWLYEEDVLSTNVAHYWSPRSSHLLYANFDDTEVIQQEFPWYGDERDVYGKTEKIAYPKAGYIKEDGSPGPNTKVKLIVVSTADLISPKIIPAPTEFGEDFYYTRVAWQNDDHVLIVWTNRIQNEAHITLCDVTQDTVECEPHRSVTTSGWIDAPYAAPLFIDNGHRYLSIVPAPQDDDEDLWRHIQLTDLSGAEEETEMLTKGHQEITSIVGYNEADDKVYYISTNGDPKNRHLMRVTVPEMAPLPTIESPTESPPDSSTEPPSGLSTAGSDPDNTEDSPVPHNGSKRKRRAIMEPECLTCDDEECSYVSASLSLTGELFIRRCLGPAIPTYSIRSTKDNEVERMLEDNSVLKEALMSKYMPTWTFDKVTIQGEDEEEYEAEAEIFLPPNYSEDKTYPLLVYAYAGPGSQRVSRRYWLGSNINGWLAHLKSEHEVVVASIDGRGSGFRGEKFRHMMFKKLGTVEVQDQLTGGQAFRDKYAKQGSNAAIFGWSYGGQTSSLALGHEDNNQFQCALAVAPVANKLYYDTAYTERYLGLATENEEAYNNTNVLNKIHNFKDKHYFLAHGTADDNVHFMHAAQLVKALAEAEIQYSYYMYVDENHGIGSYHQSRHLFRAMTDFLTECYFEEDEVEPPPDGATGVSIISALVLTSLVFAFNFVM